MKVRLWKKAGGVWAKTEIVFALSLNDPSCVNNAHWVNERDYFKPFEEGVNPNRQGLKGYPEPVKFPDEIAALPDPVVVGMLAQEARFARLVFNDPNYDRLMRKWINTDEARRQREVQVKAVIKGKVQGTPVKENSPVGQMLKIMQEGASLKQIGATEAQIKQRCKMFGYTYRLEMNLYYLNETPRFF